MDLPPAKRVKHTHNNAFVQALQEMYDDIQEATSYIRALQHYAKAGNLGDHIKGF